MIVNRGPTLTEQVYAYVRDKITGGEYALGQVIVESELATELGVSRTPVSNALIMLKERGLLEERGSKLAVPHLTLKDVIDLYYCRVAFDGLATRMAAELITKQGLAQLERYLKVWDEPSDSHPLWVADLRFHNTIYDSSGNRHLIRFAQMASEIAAVYRRNTIRRLGEEVSGTRVRSQEDVQHEHQQIFEALAAKDSDRAEAAARQHIENVIEHLGHMKVLEPSGVNDS